MKIVKLLSPVLFVFGIVTMLVAAFKDRLLERGLDPDLLLAGNLFLFSLSVLSFLLLYRSVKTPSPQSFIRNFYLSFLVKFVLVASAALIYGVSTEKVNRFSVLICMLLYLVYTFIELRIILKESKQYNAK